MQGSRLYNNDLWKRAHDIWAHAEQILSKPTTEFERTNAIMDLRRAIERRVRLLDERYSFRSIPLKDKPSEILALLEFVGVVRPRMLQKLIDIRNAVEHGDAEPPDLDTCQVFLEFTWYFLKSTDLMVQKVVDSVLFEEDEDRGYWIEIHLLPPDDWVPSIRGWISPNLISNIPREEWIFLKLDKCETRAEAVARLKKDMASDADTRGWGKEEDDFYFLGEARGTSEALTKIYKQYFEIVW